ncbi:predicted protein [Histoplasma mississippiense (nom. inval.)]|uniref:predicted protein n=1 Tax=Ajellomyces capsulatus (strain NAm1 / WU24) TaxID=2059318 RepID=UPI000157BA9F|nr:predicted protein [Histoplasma mississippiense (nom. inval.)]EDN05784.1 predicted protein [Histoplasma mississippiense (nom. inval.)]
MRPPGSALAWGLKARGFETHKGTTLHPEPISQLKQRDVNLPSRYLSGGPTT